MSESPFAQFNLEKAIGLRWALRDILGKRTKLMPTNDSDLQILIDLGLVEIRDDELVVTRNGLAALDYGA